MCNLLRPNRLTGSWRQCFNAALYVLTVAVVTAGTGIHPQYVWQLSLTELGYVHSFSRFLVVYVCCKLWKSVNIFKLWAKTKCALGLRDCKSGDKIWSDIVVSTCGDCYTTLNCHAQLWVSEWSEAGASIQRFTVSACILCLCVCVLYSGKYVRTSPFTCVYIDFTFCLGVRNRTPVATQA